MDVAAVSAHQFNHMGKLFFRLIHGEEKFAISLARLVGKGKTVQQPAVALLPPRQTDLNTPLAEGADQFLPSLMIDTRSHSFSASSI